MAFAIIATHPPPPLVNKCLESAHRQHTQTHTHAEGVFVLRFFFSHFLALLARNSRRRAPCGVVSGCNGHAHLQIHTRTHSHTHTRARTPTDTLCARKPAEVVKLLYHNETSAPRRAGKVVPSARAYANSSSRVCWCLYSCAS